MNGCCGWLNEDIGSCVGWLKVFFMAAVSSIEQKHVFVNPVSWSLSLCLASLALPLVAVDENVAVKLGPLNECNPGVHVAKQVLLLVSLLLARSKYVRWGF